MKVNLRARKLVPLWRVRFHMHRRGAGERETAEYIDLLSRLARTRKH